MAFAILNGGSRYGSATIGGALPAAPAPAPAPAPGTAIISRPVASVPISTIPRPVTAIPTVYQPPRTALPQPAFPPPSVSVVSATPSLPVLQRIGPALTPTAQHSITQGFTTPNQVAAQPATGYQEPVPYTATLPVVSVPSSFDVGSPTARESTVAFGLTENTWLLILIGAAVILFLMSGK